MARRLKLKKYITPNVNYVTLGAYRVRIEAHEAEDMDSRVFVWRRDPVNPYTSQETNTFFAVASPVDMEEYPPEDPDPDKAYPFFRRSWVELDFRAVSDGNEAWVRIVELVCQLITSLNLLDNLNLETEVWVCSAPAPVESSESEGA